ncbi:DUF892 family protein [Pedobacter rhodius]|uniref:DUF892 family protein n=1 Tax=Pedobacter rhodius TaxID=3004098 RepID=A0ABT4L0U9_9SPHI|nr:DUF892 family protein [Pedobacter sp. SJ11]MCZ4224812.1 DUF892 family protein [Pedobacter sp. SJ11]
MNTANNDFTGQEANATLRAFFIQHLNSIYSAKSHLVANLPLLRDLVEDENLLMGIGETIDNVEKQIARMEIIYSQLDTAPPEEKTIGLKGLIDEAFLAIQEQSQDPMLRDMCILFYLQNIENVEVASFQLLRMAAVKLNTGQVGQLLKDNFEEAKKNRTLLLLISAKYITSASDSN